MASHSEQRSSIVDRILDPASQPPVTFDFTNFLTREYRFGLDPHRPTCAAYAKGHCPLGNTCPDKHPVNPSYNNLVCKHWLRGLCKKGIHCDFLHEYNLRSMPECMPYSRTGYCPNYTPNPDDNPTSSNNNICLYQHIPAELRLPPCPAYERGFCPLGPACADRHVKRDRICPFWLAGFCPDGTACQEGAHPKWVDDAQLKKPTTRKVGWEDDVLAQAGRDQEEARIREEDEAVQRGELQPRRRQWQRRNQQQSQHQQQGQGGGQPPRRRY